MTDRCHFTRASHDPVSHSSMQADMMWQIAKGYLRAMVAAHGAASEGDHPTKYELAQLEVEEWIKKVELAELNL